MDIIKYKFQLSCAIRCKELVKYPVIISLKAMQYCYFAVKCDYYYYIHLTAFFPGQPG